MDKRDTSEIVSNSHPHGDLVGDRGNNSNFGSFKLFLLALLFIALEYFLILTLNKVLDNYFDNLVDNHNKQLTEQIAFLLTEQIEKLIVMETSGFNLNKFNKFNKNNPRKALTKFIANNRKISEVHLINPDNQIVISSQINREGKPVYTNRNDIAKLSPQKRTVLTKSFDHEFQDLEVIWPVYLDKEFKGYIQCAIRLPQPVDLEQLLNRIRIVVIGAMGIALGLLILLVLWITWRLNKKSVKFVETEPPVQQKEDVETDKSPTPSQEGTNSVFSKLNELYDGASDLDQSFQASEEKVHSMMRGLNQGMLILDLNMHIITHNDYVLDVLQIRTKSTAQKKVFELLQKNPRLLEMYRRAKDPLTHEVKQIFSLNLLSGRRINVEVFTRPFYNGDEVFGVTFYMKNLEMLKELEHTLQRSMKYGVISQLSSSIGHEIRNPLSSLAFHTEIVDNMVAKSIDDEKKQKKIKKSINILNSEVERLQKLIDQFFNLAKAQEIQLTFENINDLMREILDLVYQQAIEKNIEITKQFSKNLPMVKVSKDQMKQVIINLILNGYDAMPEGGLLTIRTFYHEGFVFISIIDTGQGIRENVRDNIFDLYFTTKDTGGGIGLAISRKIVEAHEGQLYFETKTGVGTVFHIKLPTSQN